jgi:CheY-like chemotaxis protein
MTLRNNAPSSRKLVLVVEDNKTNAAVLVKMLDKLGFDCIVANDGLPAIELLGGMTPDLILMDINMPGMDGITAAREIRKLGLAPDAAIIAVTAMPLNSAPNELAAMSLDAVVSKPVRLDILANTLAR